MVAANRVESVVFLVYWPVTAREEKKWHFDYLRRQGFAVEVYDLTGLLNKKEILRHPVPDESRGPHIRKVRSYGELASLIKESSGNSVYIDYIIGLSDINLKTEKVFRLLKRHNARYCIVAAGALPLTSMSGSATGLAGSLLKKLRKASDLPKLADYAVRKLINALRRHSLLYPLPSVVFGGESEVLKRFAEKYGLGARTVAVHSLDHDTYLEFVRSAGYTGVADNTCVFLDEAATDHPDFELLKIEPLGATQYFPAMRRLFDRIEERTGLRVVVAAHPRSKYEDMPGVYGDRELIKGRTVELVSRSSMVVAHASTAVSFVVLFDKPLMLVKTPEMEKNGYSVLVDTMAEALGLEAVTAGENGALDRVPSKGSKYEEYKYKYIKSRGVEDLTVWEVVAGTIKRL